MRVLGPSVPTIRDTEDRDLFVKQLQKIDVKTAQSRAAINTKQAVAAAEEIGYPVMVRAGFALGGEGSGVVRSEKELAAKLSEVFRNVSQVLVEEYLGGWKEIN